MKKNIILIFIILFFLLSGCEKNIQPEALNGVLDLSEWDLKKDKPVELKGEWDFYWQQLLYEEDFLTSNQIPNKTGNMQVPGTWNGSVVNGEKISGHGYGTYHLRVLINFSFETIALKILPIQTASRIYINGELISSAGTPGINSESSKPKYKPQTITYKPDKNYLDILIQVSNFDHRHGGVWGTLTIGSDKDMSEIWQYNRDRDFFIIGAIIIMGLYHLGLFFIRKQEREALYFSIYCFVIALRVLSTGNVYILDIFQDLPWKALIDIVYISFFTAIPLFGLFIYSLFKDKILKIMNWALIITGSLFSLITIVTPVSICSWLIPIYQIATLILGFYIMYLLIRSSLKKDKLAIVLLAGFIIMFATVINDILYAADIMNTVYIISYGILLFIIFQAIVMTVRFARSFREVERQKKQLLKTNIEYRHEIDERGRLEEDLHISYQKNAHTRTAIIMGLAKLAEYRDTDTGSHLERIQEYNSLLAGELQKHPSYLGYITDEYIKDLHLSSILHDIGKVGIPDSILQKPAKLTAEEFEIMKNHSIIGGESIKVVEIKTGVRSFLTLAKEIAFMHHEKWDGSGYPNGITGSKIPLSARLTALVDAFLEIHDQFDVVRKNMKDHHIFEVEY